MTRAFVALLLDEAVRAAVAAEIERLRARCRAIAWVPADNLHITLKFLGEQSDGRLGEVQDALAAAVATLRPFRLGLHGLGAFPGLERPRILWVGVSEGALPAREVQARVAAALARRGFAGDSRPWHPHLTIGRVFDERRRRREEGLPLGEAIAPAAHGARLTDAIPGGAIRPF